MEDGEKRSQSCFGKYGWFIPDLMWNTQRRFCTNITSGSKYSRLPIGQLKLYRYPDIHFLHGG